MSLLRSVVAAIDVEVKRVIVDAMRAGRAQMV